MPNKLILATTLMTILFLGLLNPKPVQHDNNIPLVQVFKLTSPVPITPTPVQVSIETQIKPIPTPKPKEVSRGTSNELYGFEVVKVMNNFKMSHYGLDPRDVGKNSKGIGASGRKVMAYRSVAVDRNIIPLGTYIYIEGYNILRADDTGLFRGNQVDMFTGLSYKENIKLGIISNVTIHVLKKVN